MDIQSTAISAKLVIQSLIKVLENEGVDAHSIKFKIGSAEEGCESEDLDFGKLIDLTLKELEEAKAQAVPEWISVEDELPTPNKTFSDAVIAWDGLCIRRIPLCLFNSASEVTHWMPIPQPPKAQEPAND